MIIADTSAIVALLDRSDRHHSSLKQLYQARPQRWILPWAILPEVDYLAGSHIGGPVRDAFFADLAEGDFRIDWGDPLDLVRANELHRCYRDLDLGLVDCVVMAIAERRRADAIATLDLRHFAAVKLKLAPHLYPRDIGS